jgi:phosphoribosylformylglycinamidine synthase
MQAAVVVFPGSNRDRDAVRALTLVTGRAPHTVWHQSTELPKADLIVLPGGFSHGDYLRCGAMAAHSPVMREVRAAAERGVPVLGVCNGFQILVEAHLLPGALLRNAALKFSCKRVTLRVETSNSPFLRRYNAGETITVPSAHGEGNYFAPPDLVKQLEDEDRVAFRYTYEHNGSVKDIAGILSENRRVLGMMPHPEDAVEELTGGIDGKRLFESIVEAVAQ